MGAPDKSTPLLGGELQAHPGKQTDPEKLSACSRCRKQFKRGARNCVGGIVLVGLTVCVSCRVMGEGYAALAGYKR
jgi:hypothetical protein